MPDASVAQYGTPTPTTTIGQGPPMPHALPETGYAIGFLLVVGVVLVMAGLAVRRA
jgi:hypothetical protein